MKQKNRQELEERVPEKNYSRLSRPLSASLFPSALGFFCPCSQTAYNACIFQIWSMKNYEELGGGFEPIRNGEVF